MQSVHSLAELQIRRIIHGPKIQQVKGDKGLTVKPLSFSFEMKEKKTPKKQTPPPNPLELKLLGSIQSFLEFLH